MRQEQNDLTPGEKLIALRLSYNLSRSEVSLGTGLSTSTIRRIEMGTAAYHAFIRECCFLGIRPIALCNTPLDEVENWLANKPDTNKKPIPVNREELAVIEIEYVKKLFPDTRNNGAKQRRILSIQRGPEQEEVYRIVNNRIMFSRPRH